MTMSEHANDGHVGTGRQAGAERARIRRHPERAVPELADAILRAGSVAHVGFSVDGQPYVIPLIYHYADGTLYLHGAPASRALRTLVSGAAVCVEVTQLDGLVASRDAKSHSVNYRSVVVFGSATRVADDEVKRAIFEQMTARYFPGRAAGRKSYGAGSGLPAPNSGIVAMRRAQAVSGACPSRGAG